MRAEGSPDEGFSQLSDGQRSLLGLPRLIVWTTLIFSYGLLANVVFCASVLLDPALAYEINSRTAYYLWRFMQWIFEDAHGADITYSGDDLPEGESALVISNHVSWSDYYLVHSLALRAGMLPYCRYFAKDSLKYLIPIFGFSLWAMGMVMVHRDWVKDSTLTEKAFRSIKQNKRKIWLVSYVEGTRYTPEKLAQARAFAKKRDLHEPDHVLLPRTKGFVAAVNELRDSHVKYVYDFTILYIGSKGEFQKPTSLTTANSWSRLSPPHRYHVHVRRFSISDLPQGQSVGKWLEDVWQEKDELLHQMNKSWTHSRTLTIQKPQANGCGH